MSKSRSLSVAKMSFNANLEHKILAKISEFIVKIFWFRCFLIK